LIELTIVYLVVGFGNNAWIAFLRREGSEGEKVGEKVREG